MSYLGKLYGYLPEDPYQVWKIESFNEGIHDMMSALLRIRMESDPEIQKKDFINFLGKTLPNTLGVIEKRLISNLNRNYVVGESLTIADFGIISVMNSVFYNDDFAFVTQFKAVLDNFPVLKAYTDNANENIFKDYLANRPKSHW